MSTPNGQQAPVPLFDAGQQQIAEVPAMLSVATVDTSAGQRLGLTLRIPNGTVSVLLDRKDAEKWRDDLARGIAAMHGLIIPNGSTG